MDNDSGDDETDEPTELRRTSFKIRQINRDQISEIARLRCSKNFIM